MTETFKEYTIVRLDASNIKHLQALSKAVWGNEPEEDMLYLKYHHPESAHAFLGYFAFDAAGNAACFQGATRLSIAYKNEIQIVAQSTDSMTHPQHTGKGLFYYIASKTYQLCKDNGMIMVMGYANQNSLPIVTGKIGFKVADYLQGYSIAVGTLPLAKLSLKIPFFKRIYQHYQHLIFSTFKIPYQIPYSFSKEEYPVLLREDTLIAYKQARGVFSLQIEGTILWIKITRDLFIGDMKCPNEEEWLRVMKKLKQLCFWTGIRTIHFQSCKGTQEQAYFEKYYPSFESLPLCYLDFGYPFPIEKYKATFGDIDIF
ncbi:MAG: GNAT family N-acetyltransferase [Bacteroidia bacterium]|nr:GNAT family N-acetyltransferase [Bacteroidia bacterium]